MCKEFEEEKDFCCHCGAELSEENVFEFNGDIYCEDCLDEYTFICSHCEERYPNDENMGDNSINLCENCFDYYYTRCENCGRIIHNDSTYYLDDDYNEEYSYCEDCYEREKSRRYIHDYSYKPDPIFRGIGQRYFGVELEIDNGGKDEENACELLDVANVDCENIYIKTDSSLSDGLEIVTHPMTLDYHINSMPWNDICGTALNLDYRSHNTKTSGLHIHVNRSAFGSSIEEQEECIARILYFFESNWCELLRFSRRNSSQLNRWAKRYGWKETPADVLYDAKNKCRERYTCVNITNYSTIEFRIFRGTLKYNTIIATLQLVDALCDEAMILSDEGIKNLAWSEFTAGLDTKKYKELIRYLKERRLYVNEPVIEDESEGI